MSEVPEKWAQEQRMGNTGERRVERETGVGGCMGWGLWQFPQMALDRGSETITPNPARKQKQVAQGWVSHCDSASSLGTVTPSLTPPPTSSLELVGLQYPPMLSVGPRLTSHLCTSPAGGHSHGSPTAGGADSHQGDISEESASPVSPHPKARLRLLRPSSSRPASPRG